MISDPVPVLTIISHLTKHCIHFVLTPLLSSLSQMIPEARNDIIQSFKNVILQFLTSPPSDQWDSSENVYDPTLIAWVDIISYI